VIELAPEAAPAALLKIGDDEKGDVDGVEKGEKGEDDEGAAEKGADGVGELLEVGKLPEVEEPPEVFA
jgi:hypothetical protein